MDRLFAALLGCIFVLVGSRFDAPVQADTPLSFLRAAKGYDWQFPRDFGAHPGFQTEWWYYTGHLFLEGEKVFAQPSSYGFQLTFFRRDEGQGGTFFLAHAALSDHRKGRFLHEKRFSPGGTGLSGSRTGNLDAWNREWKAERIGDSQVLSFSVDDGPDRVSVRLIAAPRALPVLHGDHGFSRKGSCEECASHYYSFPRIDLSGHIERGAAIEKVHGLGWMDHEFMTNALTPEQVGWDWFSIILPGNRSLMIFELRNKSGDRDFASGTIIEGTSSRSLTAEEFTVTKKRFWESAKSGGRYPIQWQVEVPSAEISLTLTARQADQELYSPGSNGITYWEGAAEGVNAPALAYVEMTGYDKPIGKRI